MESVGNLDLLDGSLDDAFEQYLDALEIIQQFGERKDEARIYFRLGAVAKLAGNILDAQRLFQEGLEICREGEQSSMCELFQAQLDEIVQYPIKSTGLFRRIKTWFQQSR